MAYFSTTERAATSEQLIVNAILPGLHGVKPNRGRDGWSFYCPLDHRKQNAPAAIWVNDDGWISIHCFDCRRNDELRELLVAPHLRHRSALPPAAVRQSPAPPRHSSHALTIRSGSGRKQRPSPSTPSIRLVTGLPIGTCGVPRLHAPACLALASGFPNARPGPHTGAGSIVALLAQPAAWAKAWPRLPNPQAVEIIAVGSDGQPALDRPESEGGLGKRTLGSKVGAVLILGNPLVADAELPVRVAEGVADALALAARFAGPAIASMGDAGMTSEGFPQWLATATDGVVIHADNDDAGQAAASRLCGAVRIHGGTARAVLPPQGKDAGVVAGDHPFEPLTEHWPGYADTLAEMNGWPRWEAQRQAALLMEEVLA